MSDAWLISTQLAFLRASWTECVSAIPAARYTTAPSACSLRGIGSASLIAHSIQSVRFMAAPVIVRTVNVLATLRRIGKLRRIGAAKDVQCLNSSVVWRPGMWRPASVQFRPWSSRHLLSWTTQIWTTPQLRPMLTGNRRTRANLKSSPPSLGGGLITSNCSSGLVA